MRNLDGIGFFLIAVTFCPTCLTLRGSHHALITQHYPYTLLGDDFGILTEEDLALSACIAQPVPFSVDSISHPYWQCFSTEGGHVECEDAEYDEDERSLLTLMAIVVRKDGRTHEYLSRRAIHLQDCKDYAAEWKRLTTQQDHVCVSGAFINSRQDEPDHAVDSWVFESFKTAKGCVSYFKGYCDLHERLTHGCKLQEMT